MPVPLGWVVDRITEMARGMNPELERTARVAYDRCNDIGSKQYVDENGVEKWENKSTAELIKDIEEELADGYAYCCALSFKSPHLPTVRILSLLADAHSLLREHPDGKRNNSHPPA